jgi:hypothetical protein
MGNDDKVPFPSPPFPLLEYYKMEVIFRAL